MVNIALIGYGYWGPNISRNVYQSKKTVLNTICDKSEDRLKKAKDLYAESVNYCKDYRELLSDSKIDAFAIAVETSAHFEIAKAALLSGKHIFVEKPLTSSSNQTEGLINIAKEKNLIIQVDHIMVYHYVIRKIKELIDNGELGDILYIDSSRMNLGLIKHDVNVMWDLGVHDIAIIDYLSNGKEPYYIEATGQKKFGTTESLTYLTMKYDDFIVHIKSSWLSPLKERRLIVAGTKKMVVFDEVNLDEKMRIYDKGIDMKFEKGNQEYGAIEIQYRAGDVLIPKLIEEDSLRNGIEHFATCVENHSSPITDGNHALRILKILERANSKFSNSENQF